MEVAEKLVQGAIAKCIKCKDEYTVEREKYRFCKNFRIDYGNQVYLDNRSITKIRERKDRKEIIIRE